MTTPPPDRPDPVEPDPTRWASPEGSASEGSASEGSASEPVSLAKSDEPQRAVAEPAPEFDPYRFGAPEHPVPPEYAPPGYRPPPPTQPPPAAYGWYPPYAAQPGPSHPGTPYAAQPGPSHPGTPYAGGPPGTQPWPQGGAPVPPWQHGYPQPRTGNGKAIAALVCRIASVVLCWLSIFDIVPIILAVVFGILGTNDANRRPNHGGKGMAVAGIVLSVVGAILATVLTVYLYNKIKPCLNDYQQGSAEYNSCVRGNL
jgi:hypothetical protein